MDVRGRRVTVMGLGTHGGGVAAARFLAEHGAVVTVTDLADEVSLAESLAQLRDVPIQQFRLGGHAEEDFHHADVVLVNPAVKPGNAYVGIAQATGAAITSEVELFLNACLAPIIGVTGSNGKSTTASMLTDILRADGRRTWLGGNIGVSLLPQLAQILPTDIVVLELSSFQLYWLSAKARLPEVAVFTGLSPNHLDWHGSFDDYARAKRRLIEQRHGLRQVVVAAGEHLLLGDNSVGNALGGVPNDVTRTQRHRGRCLQNHESPLNIEELPPLEVPGFHNQQNAALAASAALAVGCKKDSIKRGLSSFQGLAHRIKLLGEVGGRDFYNDSKSTTPEAAEAALASVHGRIWLLAGGHDKGASFESLAAAVVQRAQGAAFFGRSAPTLLSLITRLEPHFACEAFERLEAAFDWCWRHSAAGDAILLSPACASYDQFSDYRHRGRTFAALVAQLDPDLPKHTPTIMPARIEIS